MKLALVLAVFVALTLSADEVDSPVRIHRQAMFVSESDVTQTAIVCRTHSKLQLALGRDFDAVSKQMRLDKVDFEKHCIVVIHSGNGNAFGVSLSLDKVELAAESKSATVHWTHKGYFGGAAPPNQMGNPTLVAVLDRYDGRIQFQRNIWQWPKNTPFPPSAPRTRQRR